MEKWASWSISETKALKPQWLPWPRWPFHKLCNIRRIILVRSKAKSLPLNVCLFPARTPPQLWFTVSEWSVIGSCGREETRFLLSCSSGPISGLPVVVSSCRASLSSAYWKSIRRYRAPNHLNKGSPPSEVLSWDQVVCAKVHLCELCGTSHSVFWFTNHSVLFSVKTYSNEYLKPFHVHSKKFPKSEWFGVLGGVVTFLVLV